MRPVVIRILHACGMIDVHEQIRFHPEAVEKGLRALRAGAPVLCDSRMVANGIIARHLPANNPHIKTYKINQLQKQFTISCCSSDIKTIIFFKHFCQTFDQQRVIVGNNYVVVGLS